MVFILINKLNHEKSFMFQVVKYITVKNRHYLLHIYLFTGRKFTMYFYYLAKLTYGIQTLNFFLRTFF